MAPPKDTEAAAMEEEAREARVQEKVETDIVPARP